MTHELNQILSTVASRLSSHETDLQLAVYDRERRD